jgi:hypothetical protein
MSGRKKILAVGLVLLAVMTALGIAFGSRSNRTADIESLAGIKIGDERDFVRIEIEAALHHELYQREAKMRQESNRIIKEAEKIGDYEEYRKRFAQFMEDYNEIGASALAQYVAHRRIILDFLERAITRSVGEDKFPLESVVHQLVYPMKHTSDDLPYSEQNLWMIDERLTYHSFISSDPTLSTLKRVEVDSRKRPDLFIFDQKIVYGEGENSSNPGAPVTSLTIVEFKRPQRNDYTTAENPITQCFDLVKLIRRGWPALRKTSHDRMIGTQIGHL